MVHASEQKRPDIKLQRENWKETIKTLDVSKLVFLDESGVNINLTRRYGRAIGKERVYDYEPLNMPKSTTMLSSIRMDGTMIHQEFSAAVNREHFLDYGSNYLASSLHPGDIVIMDNLRTYKVDGVQQAIQSVGAQVLYIPPYSPDFNPIEMLWSKEGRNHSDNGKQNRRCFVNYKYRLISGFSAYFMSYVCRNPDFLFSRFRDRKIVKIKFRENQILQIENIMRKWTLWASMIIDFITQMSCGGIITDFLKQLKNIFTIFFGKIRKYPFISNFVCIA